MFWPESVSVYEQHLSDAFGGRANFLTSVAHSRQRSGQEQLPRFQLPRLMAPIAPPDGAAGYGTYNAGSNMMGDFALCQRRPAGEPAQPVLHGLDGRVLPAWPARPAVRQLRGRVGERVIYQAVTSATNSHFDATNRALGFQLNSKRTAVHEALFSLLPPPFLTSNGRLRPEHFVKVAAITSSREPMQPNAYRAPSSKSKDDCHETCSHDYLFVASFTGSSIAQNLAGRAKPPSRTTSQQVCAMRSANGCASASRNASAGAGSRR